MNTLRRIASGALWVLAAVGLACGLIWGATVTGYIKPLVVISGSMEPAIMTGDLIVDTPVDTASLQPGEVVSLHSDLADTLVTHRIRTITKTDAGYSITLKGDANATEDPLPYTVGATVMQPTMQFPGAGGFVTKMTTPAVVFPLVVGLFALLGLVLLLPAPPVRPRRRKVPAAAAHNAS
jgi:signal peptidase